MDKKYINLTGSGQLTSALGWSAITYRNLAPYLATAEAAGALENVPVVIGPETKGLWANAILELATLLKSPVLVYGFVDPQAPELLEMEKAMTSVFKRNKAIGMTQEAIDVHTELKAIAGVTLIPLTFVDPEPTEVGDVVEDEVEQQPAEITDIDPALYKEDVPVSFTDGIESEVVEENVNIEVVEETEETETTEEELVEAVRNYRRSVTNFSLREVPVTVVELPDSGIPIYFNFTSNDLTAHSGVIYGRSENDRELASMMLKQWGRNVRPGSMANFPPIDIQRNDIRFIVDESTTLAEMSYVWLLVRMGKMPDLYTIEKGRIVLIDYMAENRMLTLGGALECLKAIDEVVDAARAIKRTKF